MRFQTRPSNDGVWQGPATSGIKHCFDNHRVIFEGVIASKGSVMYFERALTMPGVDANRTIFHGVQS